MEKYLDISNSSDMAALFDELQASRVPLKGIIHSAGYVEDASLEKITWQSIERIYRAKVMGTLELLSQLSRLAISLDDFIVFSSAAGTFGSLGQLGHSSACTFQDALTKSVPASLAKRSMVIDWGNWAGIGRAAGLVDYHAKKGFHALTQREGLQVLRSLLPLLLFSF